MTSGTSFTLPTPVAGVASDNLFNPAQANNFYNNFNDASVEYSANQTNDEQRLNDLITAYQYLNDPANQQALDAENYAGFSQYMLQQLQSDITEQQNLVQYTGAVSSQTNAANTVNNLNAIMSTMKNDPTNMTAGDWGAVLQALQSTGQNPNLQFSANGTNWNADAITLINNALQNNNKGQNASVLANIASNLLNNGALTNAIGAITTQAQTAVDNAANPVLQGATINNPDYTQEQNAVNTYYQGTDTTNGGLYDPNSAVYQAVAPATSSIYNDVYNIKNDINTQAAQTGVMNSGERQLSLSNTQGAGQKAALAVVQSAQDQAKAAEANEAANIQSQQAQQTNLQNDLTGGGIQNLFSTATNQDVNAYNAQTGAQNTQNEANNENAINTAENSNNLENEIFGQAGSALGTLGETALTGALI